MKSLHPTREWTELLTLLERDGMSQVQLANSVNMSATYLNDMIRGRRRITGKYLKAISAVLRVPQSMLVHHHDHP